MKLKTKEELNKKHSYPENTTHYVVEDCFDSFKERIELFKKYRYDYEAFVEDYPYIDVPKEVTKYEIQMDYLYYWNKWLFDYCFGDVTDD